MRALVDTQLLIWSAYDTKKLSENARNLLTSRENELLFSALSIWEVALKRLKLRDDFLVDERELRDGLLAGGFGELALQSQHVVAIASSSPLNRDPFDRLLVAQAKSEDLVLPTADHVLARTGGPIKLIA